MNALENSTCVQMGEKAERRNQHKEKGAVSESKTVWNSLGAKPKNLSGRIQHLDDNEWPELQRNAFSPPASRRMQRQAGIKTTHNEDGAVFLQNRFTPLEEIGESEQSSFSDHREGPETRFNSRRKQVQRETFKNQEMLIITDKMVNELRCFWNKKKVKVLSLADKVSDLTEQILEITSEYPDLKTLIIYTGSDDVMDRQSEILKKDFIQLLNATQNLNMNVFISGPIPAAREAERCSRLFAFHNFLETLCADHSVRFVDNFDLFWERRHLFKSDGLTLNRSGAELLASNMKYFLNQVRAGNKQQEKSQQLKSEPEGQLEQTETSMEHNVQVADKETAAEPQKEELHQAVEPENQLDSSTSQTEELEKGFPQPTPKKKVFCVGDHLEDPVKQAECRLDFRTRLQNYYEKNKNNEEKLKVWKERNMKNNPGDEYLYV